MTPSRKKSSPKSVLSERQQRLSIALRENLRKRKSQIQERQKPKESLNKEDTKV